MTLSAVTAIIPCFNAAPWIRSSIESALSQTRPPAEIVVADDCSTDGSFEIAGEYPVRRIRNSMNSGHSVARNNALRECRSPVIAWLDADDVWDSNHVATVAGLLDTYPAAGVAFSAVRMIGARAGEWRMPVACNGPTSLFWESYKKTMVPAMSAVTRLEACLAVGGYREDIRVAPDYDFWVRVARNYLFVWTQEVTSNYRSHSEQISRDPTAQFQSILRSRLRLYQDSCRTEPDGFCAAMREKLIEYWDSEILDAWWSQDVARVRAMLELTSFPELNTAATRRVRRRSKVPAGVITLWRRYKRR